MNTLDPDAIGKILAVTAQSDEIARDELGRILPGRKIDAQPENAAQGLAQLVLALIDLLRQLLERQAIRRVEGGSLTDEEIERMGQTFMHLEAKMGELKELFGLTDDDLKLDLGPLGKLM